MIKCHCTYVRRTHTIIQSVVKCFQIMHVSGFGSLDSCQLNKKSIFSAICTNTENTRSNTWQKAFLSLFTCLASLPNAKCECKHKILRYISKTSWSEMCVPKTAIKFQIDSFKNYTIQTNAAACRKRKNLQINSSI